MAIQVPGYRVIRKIAQGGMSSVYLAIQISVGRVVALKVMNPVLNNDPAFSERFQREANIVGQLSHPNIVSIYDIGQHQDLNYIAMDYLPNGSAHDKMQQGISAEATLKVARDIASALDYAHEKGYVHRDIKPENILFRADNSAVLSDFGVARSFAVNSRMTHVGTVVGTPHYMSPEQTKGKAVDGRSDLYSLGVVFYEMLTGSVPYQGEEAVTVALKHLSAPIPKLPLQYFAYQKIIDKLLAKDPDQRFQRGRDLIVALDKLEQHKFSHTSPTITHPTDVTVINLLRALLSATLGSLQWRWKKLRRLRWNRERGLYFREPTKITDIFTDPLMSRATGQTSTRRHQTTQIHTQMSEVPVKPRRWWFIGAGLALILGLTIVINLRETGERPTAESSATEKSATAETSSASPTTADAIPAADTNARAAETDVTATTDADTEVSTSEPRSVETQTGQPLPLTFALRVTTTPADARVRILNIRDRYQDGIRLEPGSYHLEASRNGYLTYDTWVRLDNQDLDLKVTLEPVPTAGTELSTPLTARIKSQGPDMISIPAGSFYMGDKTDASAMPVHKVTIAKAFAISKFEITFDDYDIFAQASNRPLPDDNRWGRGDRPVINVSYTDALAYTQWLSQTTGKKYRLPTEAEWEYVARAQTQTEYWWGDDVRDAAGRANCRRGCVSKFSGLFGAKTAPVGSYPANGFGVYDTAGNVAEWVADCYADNYALAPNNGQAYEVAKCPSRVVRGGSAKDNAQDLSNSKRDYDRPEIYGEHLGFRVVMEL